MKSYVIINTRKYIFYTILIPFIFAIILSIYGYYQFQQQLFSLIATYIIQCLINLAIIIFYKNSPVDNQKNIQNNIIKINANLYLIYIIIAPIIFVIIPTLFNFFVLGNIKYYIVYKYLVTMFLIQLLINIYIMYINGNISEEKNIVINQNDFFFSVIIFPLVALIISIIFAFLKNKFTNSSVVKVLLGICAPILIYMFIINIVIFFKCSKKYSNNY